MTSDQILSLGEELAVDLEEFADCFGRSEPRGKPAACVRGRLSELPRKSVEPTALAAGIKPRTLQEFLASDEWDEEQLQSDTGPRGGSTWKPLPTSTQTHSSIPPCDRRTLCLRRVSGTRSDRIVYHGGTEARRHGEGTRPTVFEMRVEHRERQAPQINVGLTPDGQSAITPQGQ